MGNFRALMYGVGSMAEVRDTICELPKGEAGIERDLRLLTDILNKFNPNHDYRESAAAIVASWLNQRFCRNGILHIADPATDIVSFPFQPDVSRGVIASITGLD